MKQANQFFMQDFFAQVGELKHFQTFATVWCHEAFYEEERRTKRTVFWRQITFLCHFFSSFCFILLKSSVDLLFELFNKCSKDIN